ncbi:MAG: hypothetical protein ABI702_11140 [Burkholderiales bacterium]
MLRIYAPAQVVRSRVGFRSDRRPGPVGDSGQFDGSTGAKDARQRGEHRVDDLNTVEPVASRQQFRAPPTKVQWKRLFADFIVWNHAQRVAKLIRWDPAKQTAANGS